MPVKNGLSARIIEYVNANPGQLAREIGEALGFKHGSGMLSYMLGRGLVFAAGPRHWQRLYPTAEAALAQHERLCNEAKATVERKIKETAKRSAIVRKARYAPKIKPRRFSAKAVLKPALKDGAVMSPDVRVTVAPKPRERWAPDPGWVPVFTREWIERTGAANATRADEDSERRAA